MLSPDLILGLAFCVAFAITLLALALALNTRPGMAFANWLFIGVLFSPLRVAGMFFAACFAVALVFKAIV